MLSIFFAKYISAWGKQLRVNLINHSPGRAAYGESPFFLTGSIGTGIFVASASVIL
jgi:hypothetical protein